jgi:hypothetical protein
MSTTLCNKGFLVWRRRLHKERNVSSLSRVLEDAAPLILSCCCYAIERVMLSRNQKIIYVIAWFGTLTTERERHSFSEVLR